MTSKRKHLLIVEITMDQACTGKHAQMTLRDLVDEISTTTRERTKITKITVKSYARYQQGIQRRFDVIKKRIPPIKGQA